MKKFQTLSRCFLILAVLVSDAMCVAVTFQYCKMLWGIRYAYSAPASTAFLLAIPFAIGIAACAALAWFFHRKSTQ